MRVALRKLQRAEVDAVLAGPALEDAERARLLELARTGTDTTLQQTKQLLLLSTRTDAAKLVNGLREFGRAVLASHRMFHASAMQGVLANPQSMSVDRAVATLASADVKMFNEDGDKPLPKSQIERIRTNAIHCLVLLLRASQGTSLLRIQRVLQKYVWAPKARRHRTESQKLEALVASRDATAASVTFALLIAEGAARIAADNASLHLAKNVELELARGSYLPLLKAGTRMPQGRTMTPPEDFHLYCTDPRDGKAKFQICAPMRAGRKVHPNEPRTCLETMTVKVDAKARIFQERLELTVQVDENLILHAHARSVNSKDEDECEIHNLEFGLRLKTAEGGPSDYNEEEPAEDEEYGRNIALGTLTVRANVTNVQDRKKVPGEYLYQIEPGYFDRRLSPPEEQNLEKLYYQPCSVCGRASNDPACRCASTLSDQQRKRDRDRAHIQAP